MKKIVDVKTLYSVNGSDWILLDDASRIRYYEEEMTTNWKSSELDVEEFIRWSSEGMIPEVEIGKTLFRKRPYLLLPHPTELYDVRFYNDEIKSLRIKRMYLSCPNITIKSLANLLPADQFCEYLKDRGITSFSL